MCALMLRITVQFSALLMMLMTGGCRQAVAPTALPDALLGRWEGTVEDGVYVEEWRTGDDNTFEGTAILYRDGQPAGTERMRITRFADQWIFLASTGGVRITSFVRVAEAEDTWVFENSEHDYPQRIGYRVQGDTLRAFIALLDDRTDRMDFQLVRVE